MEKQNMRVLQREKTKKSLLQGMLELMKEKSFDNIGIKEICDRAGVTTGAFYHHFTSKAGIMVAAYADVDEYVLQRVPEKVDMSDTKTAIMDYLKLHAQYARNVGVDTTRSAYKAHMDYASADYVSPDRPLTKGLESIVEEGIRRGELVTEKNAEQVADELFIVARGVLYNWSVKRGAYDLTEKLISLITVYLGSL